MTAVIQINPAHSAGILTYLVQTNKNKKVEHTCLNGSVFVMHVLH